jgi:predicted nucleic acid-binding protein
MDAWQDWLRKRARLLINNYVLLETAALLQSGIGLEAVGGLHQDVEPLPRVEWVSEEQHRAELRLSASRRKLSLVDCVSFQTMRKHGMRIAFCFDSHFLEQGFEI